MAGIILADAVSGAPQFSAARFRALLGAYGSKQAARPLGSFNGVPAGTPSSIVSVSGSTWTVNPHVGVVDAETPTTAGGYPYEFETAQTGSVNAAPGSGTRLDLLSVRIDDPASGDGTSVPQAVIVYTAGTTSLPATPARSMPLAQIAVPNTGSSVITLIAPCFVASGGIATAASSTYYPASPYVGQYVDDVTLGLRRWNGTTWERPSARGRAQFQYTNATPPNLSTSLSTLAGWTADVNTLGLSVSSGVFTMPAGSDGAYEITGQVSAAAGTAPISAGLFLNGTLFAADRQIDNGFTYITCIFPTREINLVGGDQITVQARSLSGTPALISSAGGAPGVGYNAFLRLKPCA